MSRAAADAVRAERRRKLSAFRVAVAQRDVSTSFVLTAVAHLAGALETLREIDEALAAQAAELAVDYAPAYDQACARVAEVLEEASAP